MADQERQPIPIPIRARAGVTECELDVYTRGADVILAVRNEATADSMMVLELFLDFPEATRLGIDLQAQATEAAFNSEQPPPQS